MKEKIFRIGLIIPGFLAVFLGIFWDSIQNKNFEFGPYQTMLVFIGILGIVAGYHQKSYPAFEKIIRKIFSLRDIHLINSSLFLIISGGLFTMLYQKQITTQLQFIVISISSIFLLINFFYSKDRFSKKAASWFQIVLLIFLLIKPTAFLYEYLSYPFPIEYRDAAPISLAMDFTNNINPYTIEFFPNHMYVYGFLYPWLISLFLNFSTPPIIIAHFIDVFFLLLTLITAYAILRKFSVKPITAILAIEILLYAFCQLLMINGSRPDTIGLFFTFLTIYLVLFDKWRNVILSAIVCIATFYTKQYFLYIFFTIFVFLCFYQSKLKALVFGVIGTIFLIVSLILLNLIFPLHFNYVIVHHFNSSGNNFQWMITQTIEFIEYFWALLIIFLVLILKLLISRVKTKPALDCKNINAPILSINMNAIFILGFFISLILLEFKLGKHIGNHYTYYYEMLLPFLVFGVFSQFNTFSKSDFSKTMLNLSLIIFCLVPYFYRLEFVSYKNYFNKLYEIADSCDTIYEESAIIGMYKLEYGLEPLYFNGQSNYDHTVIPNAESAFFSYITPYSAFELQERIDHKEAEIGNNITERSYSCIFLRYEAEIEGYTEVYRSEGWDPNYYNIYVLKADNSK